MHCHGSLSHISFCFAAAWNTFCGNSMGALESPGRPLRHTVQTTLTRLRQLASGHIQVTLPGTVSILCLCSFRLGRLLSIHWRLHLVLLLTPVMLQSLPRDVSWERYCCSWAVDIMMFCLCVFMQDRWRRKSLEIGTCRSCTLRESASWLA